MLARILRLLTLVRVLWMFEIFRDWLSVCVCVRVYVSMCVHVCACMCVCVCALDV